MKNLDPVEFWYVTGSQHLYGNEALKQVAENSKKIVDGLNASGRLPVKIVFKPIVTRPEEVRKLCQEANNAPACAGLVLWMHTFSPSKMWIGGLSDLRKPFLHLHTQFNRDLPWAQIDMDFMNLNQAAHGDREAGFIHTRMRLNRKVVVGHWSDSEVQDRMAAWMRSARAAHDLRGARFARFGDNMRYVAVTDGDKVAAEMRFGISVNGYGVGDLVKYVNEVADADVNKLVAEYEQRYHVVADLRKGGARHESLRDGARQELGIRAFLETGNFKGFTTTFEDLHGLKQLPGLACQRLMADGYGFGAEGDWKTCALLRAMKVIGSDLTGGTSFMEDYTYHMAPGGHQVLGAHMLEICESIAASKPSLEIHPLGIGGKEDPVRLVFDAPPGPAINASIMDLGNRFRLLVNEVNVVKPQQPLPKLPVARAVWECKPDFKTACAAWIYAGGAHHTGFSYAVTSEHMEDLLSPGPGFGTAMSSYRDIQDECYQANLLLPQYKLIDLTFGNVSVADRAKGVFAIKPSGVDYTTMKPADMVVVDLEGKIVEGSLRPSSDTPTHRRLFQAFANIRSVVHTHSRNAVAFAQAGRGIPCFGTTHCDYFYGEVPVTRPMTQQEVTSAYEWETGNVIVERFANIDPADMSAVLVHSHGPFVWGPNGKKAVEIAFALEIVAEMARKTLQLSPDAEPVPQHLLDKHYKRKHGPGAYYGQAK